MTFRTVIGRFSLLAYFFLITGSSIGQWVRVEGLPARDIPSLILQGNTIYAGTDSAVFISTDGGDVWTRTSALPGSPWFIDALAVFDGKLFAGTGGNGVFISSNNGQNWMPLNQGLVGLGSSQISSFAVRNGVLYAGTRGAGVFRLQQNTWTPFGDLAGQVAGNVEFLDLRSDTLVAGAGGNGFIWYAPPGATAWTGVLVAPLQSEPLVVHSITGFRGELYIGTTYGVYRSSDNGASWVLSSAGVPVNRIVKFISTADTLFASATSALTRWYRSTDGMQWTFVEQMTGVYAQLFHKNRLYAARIDGLWYKQFPPTSVEQSFHNLQSFKLEQNYPNPFNPSTVIAYSLPASSHVTLSVLDALGREVQTLVNESKKAGNHMVEFAPTGLASGVYFYRISAGKFIQTRKLLLLR